VGTGTGGAGGTGTGGGGGTGTGTLTEGNEIVGRPTWPTACALTTPATTPAASNAKRPAADLTFVRTIP
jgi:hypothetical protein